jgi:Reverse transcriptase (RNA-dependent DNA polymerase)
MAESAWLLIIGKSTSSWTLPLTNCRTKVPSYKLGGQKYVAKVDNLWGYHQLRLSYESSKIMAVITPWGGTDFWRVHSVSKLHRENINLEWLMVLEEFNLKGCIAYIDDTVIYGADLESFLSVLDQVLGRLESFNVRLKPSKCFFGYEKIEFLGYVYNAKGVRLMPESKESETSQSQLR